MRRNRRGGTRATAGFAALAAHHARDHGLMKICVIVSAAFAFVAAVGAGIYRGEVAAVLTNLALDVHQITSSSFVAT